MQTPPQAPCWKVLGSVEDWGKRGVDKKCCFNAEVVFRVKMIVPDTVEEEIESKVLHTLVIFQANTSS